MKDGGARLLLLGRLKAQTRTVSDEAMTLSALYDAHGRDAFALAVALLADHRDAADAVHTAFGSVHRETAPHSAQRAGPLHRVYHAATDARGAARPVGRHGLLAVVFTLPPLERKALLLCLHGVSCAELAAIERVSTMTIAGRIHSALTAIREIECDPGRQAMTQIMQCAACGEAKPIPTGRSCGARLVAGVPDPTAERAAIDRDQAASDQDQTLSDRDQSGSDQDQSSADRDQTASVSDQRSSDDDQDAADHDLAAGSDPATYARTTRQREDATDNRRAASRGRDETGQARLQTANDRDRAASLRDQRAQRRDALASLRDVPIDATASRDELAMRADSDRGRAAADRAQAADDRTRAAADRMLAVGELAEAVRDRTEPSRALESAATDELTGARTRRTGLDDLSHEVVRAQRTRAELVFAFVDIDGLKQVNDTHGHPAGDALLRLVGETLRAHLRPYDVIVRYGGDEFVCALPNLTAADARVRFESISDTLREIDEAHAVTVGFSDLDPADYLNEVIARADDDRLEARRTRFSSN